MVGSSLTEHLGEILTDDQLGFRDHLMLSNKFWNEKANAKDGQWKLHITDVSNTDRAWLLNNSDVVENKNNAKPGVLNNWSLRIIGHKEKISIIYSILASLVLY